MTMFGIGLVIYQKGIEKLFLQIIYSLNPKILLKVIATWWTHYWFKWKSKFN